MHVLPLVLTQLYSILYRENIVLFCWKGVNKTKGIEQSTVQRHVKMVGSVAAGGGGGEGCYDWSEK